MDAMTVGALYKHLAKELLKDPSIAKKHILLSDDDEGNGYHELFFGLTTGQDAVDCVSFSNGISSVDIDSIDLNDYVILG